MEAYGSDHSPITEYDAENGHMGYETSYIIPDIEITSPEDNPSERNYLSETLSSFVSEDKLTANVANYPEMQMEVSSSEEAKIALIKEQLLDVPLVHTTSYPKIADIKAEGLRPYADLGDTSHSHTCQLDQELGLGEYTFFHWGELNHAYGKYHILFDAHEIIGGKTIVTPQDIAQTVGRLMLDYSFAELESSLQERVQQDYLDKMLRGGDWLEITARRVLQHTRLYPEQPFLLKHAMALGEVKYLGTAPSSAIIGQVHDSSVEAVRAFEAELIAKGIAPKAFAGKPDLNYDRATPAGRTLQPGFGVWQRLLAQAG